MASTMDATSGHAISCDGGPVIFCDASHRPPSDGHRPPMLVHVRFVVPVSCTCSPFCPYSCFFFCNSLLSFSSCTSPFIFHFFFPNPMLLFFCPLLLFQLTFVSSFKTLILRFCAFVSAPCGHFLKIPILPLFCSVSLQFGFFFLHSDPCSLLSFQVVLVSLF